MAQRESHPCPACGAPTDFDAGTGTLKCDRCGHSQQFTVAGHRVQSYPVEAVAKMRRLPAARAPGLPFTCNQCGANSTLRAIAAPCPYCESGLVADVRASPLVAPQGIVPFSMDRKAAEAAIVQWLRSRFVAQNGVRLISDAESFVSIYLPYWFFDLDFCISYSGATQLQVPGKPEWYWRPVEGVVRRRVTPEPVLATEAVRSPYLRGMAWYLKKMIPFQREFLVGHRAPYYDYEMEAGFELAKPDIAKKVVYPEGIVNDHIGGFDQRIDRMATRYENVRFKLVYLPVWVCTYVYRGEAKQILVSGDNPRVYGDVPKSLVKVALLWSPAIIILLVFLAALIL